MLGIWFQRWRKAVKGVAAVEFAVTCPALFIILAAATDYGMFNWEQSKLNQGVESAANYAYITGTGVTATNIQALVTANSGLTNPTVNVVGPGCYCVTGTSPNLVLSAATCGAACPDGVTTGSNYVSMNASYVHHSVLPFYSSWGNMTATAKAVVILQ